MTKSSEAYTPPCRDFFSRRKSSISKAAFARVERADALVYFTAKRIELLDMREQPATDLVLIGVRQSRNLRNGLFERSEHGRSLAHSASRGRGNLERAKGIEPSYAAWESEYAIGTSITYAILARFWLRYAGGLVAASYIFAASSQVAVSRNISCFCSRPS